MPGGVGAPRSRTIVRSKAEKEGDPLRLKREGEENGVVGGSKKRETTTQTCDPGKNVGKRGEMRKGENKEGEGGLGVKKRQAVTPHHCSLLSRGTKITKEGGKGKSGGAQKKRHKPFEVSWQQKIFNNLGDRRKRIGEGLGSTREGNMKKGPTVGTLPKKGGMGMVFSARHSPVAKNVVKGQPSKRKKKTAGGRGVKTGEYEIASK